MKALVLAPHPDDEINVAGATSIQLIRSNVEVFVAYSTNGDFNQAAELRAEEAVNSLKILGVPRDHIIWLGYGDTFNGTGNPHVYHAKTPSKSPAGHIETYAPNGFEVWHHSTYTRENFFNDLETLIDSLRADVIFCVDFDFHADHRALSLAFDKAMCSILRRDRNYRPEVYKKFAYATAFTAVQDLHSDNLLSTPRPTLDLEAYDFDLIDKFNYVWSDRVRFPMPSDCREPLLKDNPIARAVFAHRSQRIQWNALAIINADEIFFERRTDSITFDARVTSSSGDAIKVCDFQMLDVDDINASPPVFTNYYWAPSADDVERRITFDWENPQRVACIKIYGTLDGSIDKLRVSLDNNTAFECAVERGGRPTIILLPAPIEVIRAEFTIIEGSGDFGIGEIEMLPTIERRGAIKPFIKIMCDDQFIYDYAVPSSIKNVKIGVYRFRCGGAVQFTIDGGDIESVDDGAIVTFRSDVITVRAECGDMFDEVTIRRVSSLYFWRLRLQQRLERLRVRLRRHWG